MTEPLETLTHIAARILNVPEGDINVDAPVNELGLDDEEWRDAFEEAATRHSVEFVDILNTMPVYRIKRSDMVMDSLADLAAFSPRASAMLHEFTTRLHEDTLRSLAQSIAAGRYIPSGRMSESLHKPNTPAWVVGKGLVLTAIASVLPLINVLRPCNPFQRYCFEQPMALYVDIAQFTFPILFAVILLWLGPGLYDIWIDVKKQRARRKPNKRSQSKLSDHP